MPDFFTLYDFVGANKKNEFKEWTRKLQITQRARLNEKLDKLQKNGDALMPLLLTDTDTPGIKKLRIKVQNVQLRPLLCNGPIDIHNEYTLLMGAKERDWKLKPTNADQLAQAKKQEVIKDPNTRRTNHEKII